MLVEFVDAGPMFVLKLDSCMAVLDQDNARDLYDELREFLGMDKQPAFMPTGVTFPSGCAEPDLPVGTKFVDSTKERDILVKTGTNKYKWLTKWGSPTKDPVEYSWEFYNETWDLTVVV